MWIITENIWKLLNACETFITVHHITSAEYITIHWGVVPTRTLTWPEDVWQCLTVSECVRPRLTWLAQPSTLILCRRHHWWSRTFCCPIASDICINSTGVDTSRETLLSQCQGESVTCDPKPARLVFWCLLTNYGVIAASTWMNNNAEKKPFNQRMINVI